ncbi:hypothetical protein TNCV_3622081 [Trichonephila clavipes]|nr:hypothetical protein TNCV_3622081 [Trichonephila clavipes]
MCFRNVRIRNGFLWPRIPTKPRFHAFLSQPGVLGKRAGGGSLLWAPQHINIWWSNVFYASRVKAHNTYAGVLTWPLLARPIGTY